MGIIVIIHSNSVHSGDQENQGLMPCVYQSSLDAEPGEDVYGDKDIEYKYQNSGLRTVR